MTHATHAPEPSQTLPPIELHAAPAIVGGFEGTPPVHRSSVQSSPSTGTSVFSGTSTALPEPSQRFSLQSPVVCAVVGVPIAVKLVPQTPAVHVRAWQSSSMPGQSEGIAHPTQEPAPSQTTAVPQEAPAAVGGFDGTPAVHTSSVQGLPSSGTSVSSSASCAIPAPSHCFT